MLKREVRRHVWEDEILTPFRPNQSFFPCPSLSQRNGLSPYNQIFEFRCDLEGSTVDMIFTSVTGHLMQLEFDEPYRVSNKGVVHAVRLRPSGSASASVCICLHSHTWDCAFFLFWCWPWAELECTPGHLFIRRARVQVRPKGLSTECAEVTPIERNVMLFFNHAQMLPHDREERGAALS